MATFALVAVGLLAVPLPAGAQAAAATADPHPMMPWAYPRPDPGPGPAIRYIQVPPQQVMIELSVDVPAGVPPQTQQQVLEIPGYVMTETTNGYLIPERWTLQQPAAGVFQWQRAPAEFRRK
jgi:hypothetical protein